MAGLRPSAPGAADRAALSSPRSMDEPNRYQLRTSPAKLRGQYYTPPELATLIVRSLAPGRDDLTLDPACGDGAFLVAAADRLARSGLPGEAVAARLVGFEIDPEAAVVARQRLAATIRVAPGAVRIVCGDALDHPTLASLLAAARIAPPAGRLLVVGNPPYVEAKRLPKPVKTRLKARYPAATSGAPDLYLYFLDAALGWLRDRDALAFVLPNKVLVANNAASIRRRLLDRHLLRGFWRATDLDLFPASVYPVVLLAGPNRSDAIEIARLERENGSLALGDRIAVPSSWFRTTSGHCFFPVPTDGSLREALARMLASPTRLGDLLDIRWSVSFHRAGLRERYVTATPPDRYAGRFLGGGTFAGNGEVTRYRIRWAGHWIRYDEEELRRLGNPLPDRAIFARPKIVICQNGRTLRAAYDACDRADDGFVLKDTLLCALPRRETDHPLVHDPRSLVGLLCSRAIHFCYSHLFFGGHVGGGYLHFLRSFLRDLPVGEWNDGAARVVAAATDSLASELPPDRAREYEETIERYVNASFGLSPDEIEAIRRWAEHDRNWQARDRTGRRVVAVA